MRFKYVIFFACLLVALLFLGCDKKRPNIKPTATPTSSLAVATAKPGERLLVDVQQVESFSYEPALFNDMFCKHPVEPLGNDKYAYFVPGITQSGEEKTGTVTLKINNSGSVKILFEGDANNWHLRSTPDGSALTWLSWAGKADTEHIALMKLVLGDEPPKPVEAFSFPPQAVVLDYFWYDAQYLYALLVYDDGMKDVRLGVGDVISGVFKETITTHGFPHLAETDPLGICGKLTYSRKAGIGYFSASGCLFAFQLASGEGGIFLDGAGLFFLTSPTISDAGDRLSFYSVPVGGDSFFNCEMNIPTETFCAFLDRRISFRLSPVDFLFTSHNFYLAGEWPADIVSMGDGLVSIESTDNKNQILVKTETDTLSLLGGAGTDFFVMSRRGLIHYRLSGMSFDAGFESRRWKAPPVKVSRYPNFRKPEDTLRSYLASFGRGDVTVWTVCMRDIAAQKWVASVGDAVGGRSLKLVAALRNYRRFKTLSAIADKTVLVGELEVCGDMMGSEAFTLTKMGEMWIIDTIQDAAILEEE